MDRFKFTTIAHTDHKICSPISDEKADRLLALMALEPGQRVLDVGCGKAEMLIRLAERFNVAAVGIDPNPTFLAEARAEVSERIPGAEITFTEAEAGDADFPADTFDAALCIGATHAYGDYLSTLAALRKLVKPGGLVLVGEGYWKQDPAPGYLELLGASPQDYADHAGNVAAAVAAGLTPLYTTTSSLDEWDHYEGLYLHAVECYTVAHPDDIDSPIMQQRIRLWRDTYLRWGRDTLGFGLYLFRN